VTERVQASANTGAIYAEDPGASVQGTTSEPAPGSDFEEPPALPGSCSVGHPCRRQAVAMQVPHKTHFVHWDEDAGHNDYKPCGHSTTLAHVACTLVLPCPCTYDEIGMRVQMGLPQPISPSQLLKRGRSRRRRCHPRAMSDRAPSTHCCPTSWSTPTGRLSLRICLTTHRCVSAALRSQKRLMLLHMF
jgi:hypothetical protein